MPLIQCPDCGTDISDAAPSCVKCGRPMGVGSRGLRPVGECRACGEEVYDFGANCPLCGWKLDVRAYAEKAPEAIVQLLTAVVASPGGAGDTGMLMGQLGISDGRLPERSAVIHRILEAASPAVREKLLILFVGELFS